MFLPTPLVHTLGEQFTVSSYRDDTRTAITPLHNVHTHTLSLSLSRTLPRHHKFLMNRFALLVVLAASTAQAFTTSGVAFVRPVSLCTPHGSPLRMSDSDKTAATDAALQPPASTAQDDTGAISGEPDLDTVEKLGRGAAKVRLADKHNREPIPVAHSASTGNPNNSILNLFRLLVPRFFCTGQTRQTQRRQRE